MIGLIAADVAEVFCGRITQGANKKPRRTGVKKTQQRATA